MVSGSYSHRTQRFPERLLRFTFQQPDQEPVACAKSVLAEWRKNEAENKKDSSSKDGWPRHLCSLAARQCNGHLGQRYVSFWWSHDCITFRSLQPPTIFLLLPPYAAQGPVMRRSPPSRNVSYFKAQGRSNIALLLLLLFFFHAGTTQPRTDARFANMVRILRPQETGKRKH